MKKKVLSILALCSAFTIFFVASCSSGIQRFGSASLSVDLPISASDTLGRALVSSYGSLYLRLIREDGGGGLYGPLSPVNGRVQIADVEPGDYIDILVVHTTIDIVVNDVFGWMEEKFDFSEQYRESYKFYIESSLAAVIDGYGSIGWSGAKTLSPGSNNLGTLTLRPLCHTVEPLELDGVTLTIANDTKLPRFYQLTLFDSFEKKEYQLSVEKVDGLSFELFDVAGKKIDGDESWVFNGDQYAIYLLVSGSLAKEENIVLSCKEYDSLPGYLEFELLDNLNRDFLGKLGEDLSYYAILESEEALNYSVGDVKEDKVTFEVAPGRYDVYLVYSVLDKGEFASLFNGARDFKDLVNDLAGYSCIWLKYGDEQSYNQTFVSDKTVTKKEDRTDKFFLFGKEIDVEDEDITLYSVNAGATHARFYTLRAVDGPKDFTITAPEGIESTLYKYTTSSGYEEENMEDGSYLPDSPDLRYLVVTGTAIENGEIMLWVNSEIDIDDNLDTDPVICVVKSEGGEVDLENWVIGHNDHNTEYTLSVDEDYSTYEWRVNGKTVEIESSFTFTFTPSAYASILAIGKNTITLMVVDTNGERYSASVEFWLSETDPIFAI